MVCAPAGGAGGDHRRRGIAIPIAFRIGGWRNGGFVDFLMLSDRVDPTILGRAPADIVANEPGVVDVQLFYIDTLAVLLVGFAVLVGFLAWFGLRRGQRWAWWAICMAFVVIVVGLAPRWLVPYLGVAFEFADIPPILYPLVVAPVPLVLGWFGTRGSAVHGSSTAEASR